MPPPRADVWAEYLRLRRWYWRTWLLMLPAAVPFALLVILEPEANTLLAVGLGCPMSLWFLGCAVANVAVWLKLLSWRCPRCGKRFILSKNESFPGDECPHCGFEVGS